MRGGCGGALGGMALGCVSARVGDTARGSTATEAGRGRNGSGSASFCRAGASAAWELVFGLSVARVSGVVEGRNGGSPAGTDPCNGGVFPVGEMEEGADVDRCGEFGSEPRGRTSSLVSSLPEPWREDCETGPSGTESDPCGLAKSAAMVGSI